MSKLQRKSAKLFAEDATAAAGGIAQFGSLAEGSPNYSTDPDVIQSLDAYKEGWSSAVLGTKSPAIEDRNALDYLLSYQQAYIMQRGIPEWLDTETYYQGSFASKANGKLYVSKVDNNVNHDPESDTTETYWLKFPTPAELASGYVAKNGDTMTGILNINNLYGVHLRLRDTGLDRDTTPTGSDKVGDFIDLDDASGDNVGRLLVANQTGGTNMIQIESVDATGANRSRLGASISLDGATAYGYCPTPAANSNTNHIATTEWVRNFIGSVNMLGRMNFSSAVDFTLATTQTYTMPSKGYIFLRTVGSTAGTGEIYINDKKLADRTSWPTYFQEIFVDFIPVSQGDILKWIGAGGLSGYFFPQI